ncbi:hypothetical protein [Methylocucumis oryzae]|uniref:Lipocalin-like domain-containing protein n=1 Tax=Methylocucumis oryzae TaxID=1632867 RepID=A0A0F3IHR7_9GAMM|nr:hypothetical protein [Methylocucumis oryzae]KJV06063.1 hypothetical protein VZ94_13740 [Methylocucumis oryzae]
MKKIIIKSVLLALAVTGLAYADTNLTSKDDVEGTWKLEYTRNSATAKETIPRQDTWVFKNGKVTILNIARAEGHYDQAPLAYEIEDGKLKVPYLGRTGFDTFALIEKTDNAMTLKGKFGEHYYFVKK